MEFLLQWLDDLDDLVAAVALLGERLRRAVRGTPPAPAAALGIQAAGMLLAFSRPPLAMALVCLLTVTWLYRGAVGNTPRTLTRRDTAQIAC
ncbi:MAG: hypothetical protein U5K76_00050 [Woeseiaceae bacterium]|nr:hypothetical protein [Woeseiaceae bacterium]